MRLAIGIAAAVAMVFVSVGTSSSVRATAFPIQGTVTRVIDAATIRVRLSNRNLATVTLLGVVAPPPSNCYAASSTQNARALAVGKRVRISGDRGRIRRVGRRLVGYVTLPGNRDFAKIALLRGLGTIPPGELGFSRLPSYREAQRLAKAKRAGIWSCIDPSSEDRVTADFQRPRPEGGEVHVVVEAWSQADGEHPRGLFRVEVRSPQAPTVVSGRVVCLTVNGNRATVGGVVEQTTSPAAPVESGFRIHLTDHGDPGATRDTNRNVGYAKPVPCPIEDDDEVVIAEGEVAVFDGIAGAAGEDG